MLKGIGNSVADYTVEKNHTCEECNGMGWVLDWDNNGNRVDVKCDFCGGKGYYEKWS